MQTGPTTTQTTSTSVNTSGAWDLQLCSPSKINLFLRVTRRRDDGFHDLASLFQTLSLHDKLYFRVTTDTGKDTMECNIGGIPTDERNLIIRAFQTYRKYTGLDKQDDNKQFLHTRLEKTIPHEAGLGGGSSNAATALWAINKLNGNKCSTAELIDMGAQFGSDISFFFSATGTAFCTGRGEVVDDVHPGLTCDYPVYVVKPPEGLSTGRVFGTLDIARCSQRDPQALLSDMQRDILTADFVNDLETPSFQLVPRLGQLKERLYEAGFKVVMMSGSGTSFFCIGQPNDADFVDKFGRENDVKVFPTQFQNRRSDAMWYFE